MATTLTTSWQQLKDSAGQMADESSYYVWIYAKYSPGSGSSATIDFAFHTSNYGSEGCSISGNYFLLTLDNGAQQSLGPLSYYIPRGVSDIQGTISVPVTYNASGQYLNKTVRWRLYGGDGEYSSGGSMGDASTSWANSVISLPDIDKTPSASINSISIASGGLSGNAVASVSKLSVSVTLGNIRSAYISWSGAGLNDQRINLSPTYATSETLVGTMSSNLPASASDYTVSFKLYYKNNRSTTYSSTSARTFTVRGYSVPTYGNSTYTQRCDSTGQADSQGLYGMLYLTWAVASVNGANSLNADPVVKLNGVTLTSSTATITGSRSAGYFSYIFDLPLDTEGALTITLVDKISSVNITQLAVPKSIMPLSLYQSNTSVGVSIGAMATQAGFLEYLDFFLKCKYNSVMYEIYVDADGDLHVGSKTMVYKGGSLV